MNHNTEIDSDTSATAPVWGSSELAVGATRRLAIGKLTVNLARNERDWVADWAYDQDRYVNETAKLTPRLRAVFEMTQSNFELGPRAADRNIVAFPVHQLLVPRGECTTLFISTPIWLSVSLPGETPTQLLDLPSEILSDSWFGPNTREGHLCYANETSARMHLDRLPSRIDRIITPVVIDNQGADTLKIERLSLPMPLLTVYAGDEKLSTQEVKITRTESLDVAEVQLTAQPPSHASDATPVSEPRRLDHTGVVRRALGHLFG